METRDAEPIDQEIKLTSLQKWRLKNPDYNKTYYDTVRKPKMESLNPGKTNEPLKTANMKEYKNKYNAAFYQNKIRYKCECEKCGTIVSTHRYLEKHQKSAKCEILSLKNLNKYVSTS